MEESIITGNKLIAEFMGAKTDTYGRWYYTPRVNNLYFLGDDVKEFKYHSSWDWLMPVVEKIEGLGHSTSIDSDIREIVNDKYFCGILRQGNVGTYIVQKYSKVSKIEVVWEAVIQFIEWYNKEQSVKESDTRQPKQQNKNV